MEIKFHTKEEYIGVVPSPEPAKKFIPSWYKNLEKINLDDNPMGLPVINTLGNQQEHPQIIHKQTLKSCLPFQDTMLTGYIIPLWADLLISYSEVEDIISFNWEWGETMITAHSSTQVKNTPIEKQAINGKIWKLMSPWIIESPKGYSCLITSPYHHKLDINIISAIVDTDSYYFPINFPFIWNGRHGRHYIKAGTPIAQIIPIKRETWKSSIEPINEKQQNWFINFLKIHMVDRYSKFQHKKDYN